MPNDNHPTFPTPSLLSLPPELLSQIFSYVFPPFHLNDLNLEIPTARMYQRRYRAKLRLFDLPGFPAPYAPYSYPLNNSSGCCASSYLTICKTLHPIVTEAMHDSFTGHAHISSNKAIHACPSYWSESGLLDRVTSMSVDTSYCDALFTEVHAPRIPNVERMKVYCYRDYCWRPKVEGVARTDLERMLETDEFDELLEGEAIKSIEDNIGELYLRSLPKGLKEVAWCQCLDFGDEWDGALVVEYEVHGIEDIENIESDFYRRWRLKGKRYVVLDDAEQLALEASESGEDGPEIKEGFFVTCLGLP